MNGSMMKMGLAMAAMGVATVWAGEKEIKIGKLPAAVLATAKNACPNGAIKEALKKKEDGVVAFEVEMMAGGMSCDLRIAADGTLLETEQQVAPADLPKPVQATLAIFDGSTVKKAERVQEKGDVLYEMVVEIKGQTFELQINAEGKIINIESKGKKHDEDEDDDKD